MTRLKLALAAIALAGVAACATRYPAPVEDRAGSRVAKSAPRPAARPAPAAAAREGFYTVKRGDTLYSIALEHCADYREVAQWNQLDDPTRIRVGQVLRVKPAEVKPAEERAVEVGRARSLGRVEARPIDSAVEPKTSQLPQKESAGILGRVEPKPEGEGIEFVWPAKGKVLAGFAEPRSKGIDIDGRPGDPVVAAAAGRVTYIGSGIPGLGKLVVIKHDSGFITVYAHNQDIVVKEQQSVARGQKIAELGSTDSDRPKLHFQIRKGSAPVDPMRYLPGL